MSSTRRAPADLTPYIVLAAALLVVVVVGVAWGAVAISAVLAGTPLPPANPFRLAADLALGKRPWPGTPATLAVLGELVLLLAAAAAVWPLLARWRRRTRVDVAARHLASRRELEPFTRAGAAATAKRLGVASARVGVRIGRVVGLGEELYGSWEDMHVDIWGPRTGKTTCRAIPALVEAPGAAIVTSNKRDIVDATRGVRETTGPVWVFDPQHVTGDEPTWWWNPLTYVTDVDKAARMAAVFAAYSRQPGARTDAYFDPAGEELLAYLLLAAASAGEPITTVYRWLSDPTDTTPVDCLRAAGHDLPAESVEGTINYPDKQRGGIYGTAKKNVACLVNPAITRWVTPDPRSARPQFDPAAFVAGTGTLYSLSREGQGTAGPLVTALTVAVIEAAEELATRSPGGRLAVPLLGVLDEAANVCRWRDLPDLYSHYGSRGIVLMTILQSWAQGVEVWGEHGMAKLWSAANIRVYGGGVADPRFLGDLATLIGEYEPYTTSVSVQHGIGRSRSTTTSTRLERILDAADLYALPRGRCVVFPSGSRPALLETLPWQTGPHAPAIQASLSRYAPAAELPKHTLIDTGDEHARN